MKKILLAVAACAISAAAMAQPMRDSPPRGPGMDRSHMMKPHHRQKVWVPAHREHGRRVAGHYVWR